jgi:hypothetical protein
MFHPPHVLEYMYYTQFIRLSLDVYFSGTLPNLSIGTDPNYILLQIVQLFISLGRLLITGKPL